MELGAWFSNALYIFDKTLLVSTICNKSGIEDEKIFNEEESIKILNEIN